VYDRPAGDTSTTRPQKQGARNAETAARSGRQARAAAAATGVAVYAASPHGRISR